MKKIIVITSFVILMLVLGTVGICSAEDTIVERQIITYNQYGRMIEKRIVDADGNLIPGAFNRAPIERYKYNELGQVIEKSLFGVDEKPCTRFGIHIIRFKYNEEGRVIESSRYGLNGEPIEDEALGCHIFRVLPDGKEQCYGVDGNLKEIKQCETTDKIEIK